MTSLNCSQMMNEAKFVLNEIHYGRILSPAVWIAVEKLAANMHQHPECTQELVPNGLSIKDFVDFMQDYLAQQTELPPAAVTPKLSRQRAIDVGQQQQRRRGW